MVTSSLLLLLLQSMTALLIVVPFVFAVCFCGVYGLLLLVNLVFAFVNGYRLRPHQLLVSRKAMVLIAGIVAMLVCAWSLFTIDGRYT
jgi:hypothetical protein